MCCVCCKEERRTKTAREADACVFYSFDLPLRQAAAAARNLPQQASAPPSFSVGFRRLLLAVRGGLVDPARPVTSGGGEDIESPSLFCSMATSRGSRCNTHCRCRLKERGCSHSSSLSLMFRNRVFLFYLPKARTRIESFRHAIL